MTAMKRLLFLAFVMFCCVPAVVAQSVGAFRAQLQRTDGSYSSRVEVTEHGTAASAVNSLSARYSPDEKIAGYRVRIFLNNTQNGRALAEEAAGTFRASFPDVPCNLTYKAPDFKVIVGNCLNYEEAIMLWGRVKGMFGSATIVKETLPLSVFAEKHSLPTDGELSVEP